MNKKVTYCGWVGHKNLGDDGMFEITKKYIPSLTLHWDKQYPILLGGGTNFGKKGYYKRLKAFTNQLFIIPGIGVPLMKTQEIKHRRWWKKALKGKKVKVRGPLSKEKLQRNKIEADVVGDFGFLVDAPEAPFLDQRTIGINIGTAKNRLYGWDEKTFYKNVFTALKRISTEFLFHFFSVWPEDDRICEEFGHYFHVPVHKVYTLSDFFEKIQTCDIVIGMKLHFTVFAAAAGIPFISLSYRPKCLDVLSSLKMERFSLKTDDPMTQLPRLVANVYRNKEQLRKSLKKQTKIMKLSLKTQITLIKSELQNWDPPSKQWFFW